MFNLMRSFLIDGKHFTKFFESLSLHINLGIDHNANIFHFSLAENIKISPDK